MKPFISILFLFLVPYAARSQDMTSVARSFDRINYWAASDDDNHDDSLAAANDSFQALFLTYTATNPETIANNFKPLADSGLRVVTSGDGLFRIYSWDTWTGGTMHYFRNIFQYKSGNKVFSKMMEPADKEAPVDPGCIYKQIDGITSAEKKYYITQSISILSSGLSYHMIRIFAIDHAGLIDTVKLIKTNSGLTNHLGYEVDVTASSNRDKAVPDFHIQYDKANRIISIPLIQKDGKVTSQRIRYQFKGQYFEKI